MAGMPADDLAARRKRIIYRSLYTGTKETDLLLGPFARTHVPALAPDQLDRFERLLEAPDPDVFAWATGQAPTPLEYDHDVMAMLKSFAKIGR